MGIVPVLRVTWVGRQCDATKRLPDTGSVETEVKWLLVSRLETGETADRMHRWKGG